MKEIVFATNNLHKLAEIRQLAGEKIKILSLKDIGCFDEIPEDADTLEGNASLKSKYISERFGTDCFADDTGLEIDALGGRPGVRSARYAGDECISSNNIQKVLTEMAGISQRQARFRTVISLRTGGIEYRFEGVVNGSILTEPRGRDGFGYDPVFVPTGYLKSFAEMPLDEKNGISHRAMAFEKLIFHLLHS